MEPDVAVPFYLFISLQNLHKSIILIDISLSRSKLPLQVVLVNLVVS